MSAYIELLPPDRPILMVGQPIIRLIAPGGPGGDLGDVPNAAPQAAPATTWVKTAGVLASVAGLTWIISRAIMKRGRP